MDIFEILALIFAILLCLSVVVDVVLDVLYDARYDIWDFYLIGPSIVDNLAVSIIIMVGACRRLTSGLYKACMIVLIVTDVIFLLLMIFYSIMVSFPWFSLIDLAIITPLIIFIDKIRKKREMTQTINPGIAIGSPIVSQNSLLPNNYQSGNVQTSDVSNAYQPPS